MKSQLFLEVLQCFSDSGAKRDMGAQQSHSFRFDGRLQLRDVQHDLGLELLDAEPKMLAGTEAARVVSVNQCSTGIKQQFTWGNSWMTIASISCPNSSAGSKLFPDSGKTPVRSSR